MPTFESYGAIGDGVADDRNAVYNALNSGLEITAAHGAVYYIGSNIEIAGKNINVTGLATFLFKSAVNIKVSGVAGVNTTVKTNTAVNDAYVEVTNPAGFAVGNLISITTSEANSWPYDANYRNGELHLITDIDGDKLYVDDKIWTEWVTGVNTLKVVQYVPITVTMSNIIIKYETPQLINAGLYISYAKDSVLNKVHEHDARYIGIMIHGCYNTIFSNGSINGANADNGYGLRFQGSNKSEVFGCRFFRNFKSIENASSPPTQNDYGNYPNRNLYVHHNTGDGLGMHDSGQTLFSRGSIFASSHASMQNYIVKNNTVKNFYHCFQATGPDAEIEDNTITGKTMHLVLLAYGKNYSVKNNISTAKIGTLLTGGSFVLFLDLAESGGVEIVGNDVRTLQTYFTVVGGTLDANNVTITGNTGRFADGQTYVYNQKSRIPGVVESDNTWIGSNVSDTKD
jgi:hypothetical protein